MMIFSSVKAKYAILGYIAAQTDGVSGAQISQGLGGTWHLYPCLMELERDKLIFSYWEEGDYPRRRLYRLVK